MNDASPEEDVVTTSSTSIFGTKTDYWFFVVCLCLISMFCLLVIDFHLKIANIRAHTTSRIDAIEKTIHSQVQTSMAVQREADLLRRTLEQGTQTDGIIDQFRPYPASSSCKTSSEYTGEDSDIEQVVRNSRKQRGRCVRRRKVVSSVEVEVEKPANRDDCPGQETVGRSKLLGALCRMCCSFLIIVVIVIYIVVFTIIFFIYYTQHSLRFFHM